MADACIDIEYKSEERYAKISIAYSTEEEYRDINEALKEAKKDIALDESTYVTDISHGRKVLVVEYHDDYDRQSGAIIEALMKKLNITTCS
jgi:hypothetical protein